MARLNFKNFSLFAKLSLFFLILLGLAFPFHQAQAFLGPLAALIAAKVFAFALQLVFTITWLILVVANVFLTWVIGPAFISLPYASGGVVDIGWPITRDLANMGFVFALLVIGVATALRYPRDEGYKVKKALPTLIGIILLVNFTPVIMGAIIDLANIIMMFFLGEVSGLQAIMTPFGSQFSSTISIFTNLQGALTEQVNLIAKTMMLIIFNLTTALFMFIFALLFITRYVAIWTLVILSPLAFFAYVLPGTRRYFTDWWNQFLQWTFVGVAAAFFLYLTEQLLVVMSTTPFIAPPASPAGLSLTDVFNNILPYAIIEVFLFFGLLASLTSGAVGANAVISTGKQWGKSAGGWAGKKSKGWAGAKFMESRLGKGAMNIASRMALAKTPGTGVPGVKGTLQRAAGGVFAEGIRLVGRRGMGFLESGRKGIGEAESEVEKASVEMVISKFRSAAEWSKKVGYMNRLTKKGDLDKAIEKGLTLAEISQTRTQAQKYDSHQEISDALPELRHAEMVSTAATTYGGDVVKAYSEEIFKKMKPVRVGQLSKRIFAINPGTGDFENPEAMAAMMFAFDDKQLSKFLETHHQTGADTIEKVLDDLSGTVSNPAARGTWLNTANPRLYNYLTKGGGRGLVDIT